MCFCLVDCKPFALPLVSALSGERPVGDAPEVLPFAFDGSSSKDRADGVSTCTAALPLCELAKRSFSKRLFVCGR